MTTTSGTCTSPYIPKMIAISQPLKHCQLALVCHHGTNNFVPSIHFIANLCTHSFDCSSECFDVSGFHHSNNMLTVRNHITSPTGTRTSVFACPLDRFKLTVSGSHFANPYIPWASVLAQPPEDCKMPIACGCYTSPLVPRASVFAQPLEDFDMTFMGSPRASSVVERVAFFYRFDEPFQIPFLCGRRT